MQTKEEKIKDLQERTGKEAPYGRNKNGEVRLVPARKYSHAKKPRQRTMMTQMKIGTIIDYITMGAVEINDEENKRLKVKPLQPMNLNAACREVGITYQRFFQIMKGDPALKKQYELFRENKQNYMKSAAEENILKGLGGELDLNSKELVDLSMKMLERTDKAYNPKVEVEQTIRSLNFNVDINELQRQFNELTNL